MNRFNTLNRASEIQPNFEKWNWQQRNDYHLFNDRVERLTVLAYYLTLRAKITKEVQNNYLNLTAEQISNLIVNYCEHGYVDDNFNEIDNYLALTKTDLGPLILGYVKQQINKIDNQTLKLAL